MRQYSIKSLFKQTTLSGFCFLLLAQSMVGVSVVATKPLLKTLLPITMLTFRFTLSTIILLALHFGTSKKNFSTLKTLNPVDWYFVLGQAITSGILANLIFYTGLRHTTASVASMIASTLPAIVAIFSVIFLKEQLNRSMMYCILFSVVGLLLINSHDFYLNHTSAITGGFIILLALLPESTYYMLCKLHQRKLPVFLAAALMNAINIPICIAYILFSHVHFSCDITKIQWLLLILISVGYSLFYVFWFLGAKSVKGTLTGLTTAFMPISSLIAASIFLKEQVAVTQLLGMLLVIIAIGFSASRNT